MDTLYARQSRLNLYAPYECVIIGLGGTGTWTALFLAMSGIPYLHLMDFDSLEESNLNRLPYSKEELGMTKVVAATHLLKRFRPDVNITTYGEANLLTLELAFTTHGVSNQDFVIFDCTDKIRIQRMVCNFAMERKIKYMRVGYDGTHITVTDWVTPLSTREDDEGGYAVAPSWVCPAAMAAALAVSKVMLRKSKDIDISMDIGDIGETIRPAISRPVIIMNNTETIIKLETDDEKELFTSMLDCATGSTLDRYYRDTFGKTLPFRVKTDMWKRITRLVNASR